VVGLKPTVGLVSRSGIIPINSQDTAGPMGRTVEDCAIALGAMAAEDEEDPATWATRSLSCTDYTAYLKRDGLQGMRVGVNRGHSHFYSPAQLKLFDKALEYLRKAGAQLVEGCDLDNIYDRRTFPNRAVMVYEFKAMMNAHLARYSGLPQIRTLHDIVTYNNDHPHTALRYGQDILEQCDRTTSATLTESEYLLEKGRILHAAGRDGIDRLLAENHVDVLVCPGPSDLAPISGYPIINVPAGVGEGGVAFGISFLAGAFCEGKLLTAAYAFEQASGLRVVPQ
ncbi:MAG: amidase family protein, partial [Eubacteriales bacterium]|nr:amidase family protein [Eubacteriales bacterium]